MNWDAQDVILWPYSVQRARILTILRSHNVFSTRRLLVNDLPTRTQRQAKAPRYAINIPDLLISREECVRHCITDNMTVRAHQSRVKIVVGQGVSKCLPQGV